MKEEKYLENIRSRFRAHKENFIKKIKEFCNLDNMDFNSEDEKVRNNSIEAKIKIQSKYRGLVSYHNISAERVSLPEFKIKCSGEEFEKTGICIMKEIN